MTTNDKKEPAYCDLDYPPFGKYAKGKPDACLLQDVPAAYLLWMYDELKKDSLDKITVKNVNVGSIREKQLKLFNYIHNSMDALKLENKDRV